MGTGGGEGWHGLAAKTPRAAMELLGRALNGSNEVWSPRTRSPPALRAGLRKKVYARDLWIGTLPPWITWDGIISLQV